MLINKLLNDKVIKLILAAFIAYYYEPIILQSVFTAFLFIAVTIFIFIFLTKAEYAFYIILATRSLVDIYLFNLQFAGQKVPQIIGLLLTMLSVLYIIKSRFNIFQFRVNKVYGWFLVFSFFPVFFGGGLLNNFGYWLRMSQGFFVMNLTALILINTGSESFKKIITIICWSVVVSLALPYFLYIRNFLQGNIEIWSGYVRYSGFGAAFNVFSYHLLAVFPYCLFLYSVASKNLTKVLWLVLLAFMLYTIYMTYARNVWIATATILLTWTIIKKYYSASVLAVITMIMLVLVNPMIQDRLNEIYVLLTSSVGFFELDPHLFTNRIGLWQANLHYFIHESGFLEKMLGNSTSRLRNEVVQVIITSQMRGAPEHSNYVFLLMNTGIMGLSIYLAYLVTLFFETRKLLKKTQDIYLRHLAEIFIPVICSFVLIGFATHTLLKISVVYYFSVMAGFIVAANHMEKEKKERVV